MSTVERIRHFNRSWTEVLGLLDQGLLETDHSLAEARVIFELAQRPFWDRQELRDRLGIDSSFLTRVVTRLLETGLVHSERSTTDGRAVVLALTDSGQRAYEILDRRSAEQISTLIEPLTEGQRAVLVEAMATVKAMTRRESLDPTITLRGLRPGDLGWVVQRHGAIYADEFGWNADLEALVAELVAAYRREHRHGREDAWIAEVEGARAGSVFCCERDARTAQLRMLLVEPWARGLGIGRRLVDECIGFARKAGYQNLLLWTNDVLAAARRIYEDAGFELVEEDRHRSFGVDLVGQTWMLALAG